MNIYIGNLPFSMTQEEVQVLFEEFGDVVSVKLIYDRETGKPRGFGFVEMENGADGNEAIEALDGASINGRNLRVNEARPRNNNHNSRPPRRW